MKTNQIANHWVKPESDLELVLPQRVFSNYLNYPKIECLSSLSIFGENRLTSFSMSILKLQIANNDVTSWADRYFNFEKSRNQASTLFDWATVAQIQFAHRHLPKIFCPIFICSFGHLLKWNLLKMEKTFAHEDTCSISCFNYDLPRNPWIFQPKSMLVCNLYLDRRVAFCFVVMQ